MITQERIKEAFVLNEGTGVLSWKTSGVGRRPDLVAGCREPKYGRWVIKIDYKRYMRSRLVFLYVNGWLPKYVDHKDRNPLNDRPDNLRPATLAQNRVNSRSFSRENNLPQGVQFQGGPKRKRPFQAVIKIDGKAKHLGMFPTAELAHEAYRKKSLEIHGEFVCS